MKVSTLLSVLGGVAAVAAAPLQDVQKRASGFRFGGVNLAGCDFGMNVWGGSGVVWCPTTSQISHFTSQGANLIRLPVGWQYLVANNVASTSLNQTFVAQYDNLVQSVLNTGAYAIIDIHNYARWDGKVVGTDVPGQYFANLWGLLAAKYKNNPKVIFALMNEPHDISGSQWTNWVAACQLAVNAIRAAGATSQYIVLPGNFWTHPETWASGENNDMLSITDPATGDASLLLLDAHKYFDSDGSGTSTTCTTNAVSTFQSFVSFLRSKGRQALLTEFGGGNNAGCASYISQALSYLSDNSDVVLGFTAWSAGAFDNTYELNLGPNADGSDQYLWANAIKAYLPGNNGGPTTTSTSITPSATSSVKPSTTSVAPSSTSSAPATTSSAPPASCTPVAKWGQCGGIGYTGCKVCVAGSTCTYNNDWYSQCL